MAARARIGRGWVGPLRASLQNFGREVNGQETRGCLVHYYRTEPIAAADTAKCAAVAIVWSMKPGTWPRLADLLEDQHGLFTRAQAAAAGMAWSTLTRAERAGDVQRVARGVYRLRGAPEPSHLDLRAAWLQLAPETPLWERRPDQGVVSHRSAAMLYGLGDLPAERHEFTLPVRYQSRRADVRIHRAEVAPSSVWAFDLLLTRPDRIAADLLADGESPEAAGLVVADAIREAREYPGSFATTLSPFAARFGLEPGNGLAMLDWVLALAGASDRQAWIREAAEASSGRTTP
jgi:hypothetical protein